MLSSSSRGPLFSPLLSHAECFVDIGASIISLFTSKPWCVSRRQRAAIYPSPLRHMACCFYCYCALTRSRPYEFMIGAFWRFTRSGRGGTSRRQGCSSFRLRVLGLAGLLRWCAGGYGIGGTAGLGRLPGCVRTDSPASQLLACHVCVGGKMEFPVSGRTTWRAAFRFLLLLAGFLLDWGG